MDREGVGHGRARGLGMDLRVGLRGCRAAGASWASRRSGRTRRTRQHEAQRAHHPRAPIAGLRRFPTGGRRGVFIAQACLKSRVQPIIHGEGKPAMARDGVRDVISATSEDIPTTSVHKLERINIIDVLSRV